MDNSNERSAVYNRTDTLLKANLADVIEMLHSSFRYMTEVDAPVIGHYRLQGNPQSGENYLSIRTSVEGILAMGKRFKSNVLEISLDMPVETVPGLLENEIPYDEESKMLMTSKYPFSTTSIIVPEGFRLDLCAVRKA